MSTAGIDSLKARNFRNLVFREVVENYGTWKNRQTHGLDAQLNLMAYTLRGATNPLDRKLREKIDLAQNDDSRKGQIEREFGKIMGLPRSEFWISIEKIIKKYKNIPEEQISHSLLGDNVTSAWWVKKYKEALPENQLLPENQIINEQKLEGSIIQQIQQAKQVLGRKNVHLPEVMGMHFDQKEMLPIPFTKVDLERAKLLGQHLVYRVNDDGENPLTIENLVKKYEQEFRRDGFEELVMGFKRHQSENEKYFIEDTPRSGWALIDVEALDYTYGANLVVQTEALVRYLVEDVYGEREIPEKYQKAIESFHQKKEEIVTLLESSDVLKHAEGNRKLEMLEITQMLRPWPVEALYDAIALWKEGEDFHKHSVLTARRFSTKKGGNFVTFEGFGNVKLGASIGTSYSASVGSALSRRF